MSSKAGTKDSRTLRNTLWKNRTRALVSPSGKQLPRISASALTTLQT